MWPWLVPGTLRRDDTCQVDTSWLPADTRVSWGYRRSRRIVPGVRLNFTKRGPGLGVGPRHAKLSVNSRGRRSLYLSALGFFYRKRL